MFEKRKLKKLEKLREKEKELSAIPVARPDDENRPEKIMARKKEKRKMIIRSIAPGMIISLGLGFIIYYISLPLGALAAVGTTIAVLLAGNVMMYIYTNRIYIPPGIDFLQFGPLDPDDENSPDSFGRWRVPMSLIGNIRKDLPVPLKSILVVPANENEPNINYYKTIKDDKGNEIKLYYTQSELNKMETAVSGGEMMYEVNSFYWDEDTGEIYISPTLFYGKGAANTKKVVFYELQKDIYHLNRAYTFLKMKLPLLVEKRIRELMPNAIKRMMNAKYDEPKTSNKDLSEAENEILNEEKQVSKNVMGDDDHGQR